MTYNVFSGTLDPTQSINQSMKEDEIKTQTPASMRVRLKCD